MGLESSMWASLRRSIGKHWDACRHEDSLTKGVPDVSFGVYGVQGWIELKALKDWPKRPKTIVSIPHYSQEQRIWLFQRGKAAGRTWLLVRIDKSDAWFLFDHQMAQLVGKTFKREDFYKFCTRSWMRVPKAEDFISKIIS